MGSPKGTVVNTPKYTIDIDTDGTFLDLRAADHALIQRIRKIDPSIRQYCYRGTPDGGRAYPPR
jgi:hypothetical protein